MNNIFNSLDEEVKKEFDKKYSELLRIIKNKTTDEGEKKLIEFIFIPPSWEKAKQFLGD